MIRAATLCSGIGAPETAMPDWEWLWASEIEAFPSRVLARRFPHTVNLGDMTSSDFVARALDFGPVDVLVAGTPCQAFSISGLRGGLSDPRGNLTLRALQIYEELCDAARSSGWREPVYVWENVPGVLNHKDNPFGCLLGGLAGCDSALVPSSGRRWPSAGVVDGPERTVAWRILDAQYFGLAQRRKRVFVVAGSRSSGVDPVKVLLERKGVRRDLAPGGEAREIVAALTANGVGTCGADDNQAQAGHLIAAFGGGNCSGPIDISACLTAHGVRQDFEVETFVTHTLTGNGFDASEDGTGRGTPIVPIAFDCKAGGNTSFSIGEIAGALRGEGHGGGHAAVAVAMRGRDGGVQIKMGDDKAFTLRASQGGGDKPHVLTHAVRRLTPTECSRLQGLPDDHTDVPNGNRPAADGPRYKALGNSMAVPVMRWILSRIERQREGRP